MLENWDVFFCLILFGETNLLGTAAVPLELGEQVMFLDRGLEADSCGDNTN